ncbi:MAG: hypothetical protein CR986_06890 [Ignavibacteriae bacterium]|nr:MAG: hypothetical protein CR986_06890 [Ignavibacteriota bacterium]
MKILFYTNMYPTAEDTVKGLFVKNQLESLQKLGVEVEYLHLIVKNSKTDYIKSYFSLLKKIKNNNYDLIHAHYGFMGFIAALQFKVPFVLTLHGSDANIWWQKIFSSFASFFARKIIVTNKEHKEEFGNKAVLIPTGINSNVFFHVNQDEAKKKLGLKSNLKYIVFPSARKRRVKNYPLYHQVLNKLKEMDSSYEELLLEDKTPEEVNLCYNAAEALLLTSFSEGSPLVIREALLTKLPIFSLDVGDVSERIRNYENCFIIPNNVDIIVKKIYSFTLNEKRYAKNISNKNNFETLETNAQELINIYKFALK